MKNKTQWLKNISSNLPWLVSTAALLGLYLWPAKSILYDLGVLFMAAVAIAAFKTLRIRRIPCRFAQLAAIVPTIGVLIGGYGTFVAHWGHPAFAVLGCVIGGYAGLIAFGYLISMAAALPSLWKKPAVQRPPWAGRENIRREMLCFALCLLILAPLLVVSVYNRQSSDDYNYAILTHEAVQNGEGLLGVLSAAWETNLQFYQTWQGLYSSAFLLALQPAIFGEKLYALTPWIIMLWAYACLFPAVHILNKAFLKRTVFFSATAALVLVTILMLWLPSANEGLFWYNGAVNYMPWAFTNVLNLCLLVWMESRLGTVKGKLMLMLSTVLSFLTSGGNHVTAFANILLLLILSVFWMMRQKRYPLLPLAAAIIGFAIMYLAPGTAIRAARNDQQSVIGTIWAVIVYLFTDVAKWFNVQWLLSLVLITPIGLEIARKNDFRLSPFFPLISFILSAFVLCGMLAVPYFAIGSFGTGRCTNVVWITFLFLSWFTYIVTLIALDRKGLPTSLETVWRKAQPFQTFLLIGCLAALMVFPSRVSFSSSVRAVKELSRGVPQAYAAEWDERSRLLADPDLTEVWVSPLRNRSDLLLHADLFWENTDTMRGSADLYYNKIIHNQP